ncbi:hypothetical protein D3C81_794360 [compost metagenome]
MHLAVGELPDQPGVDSAEQQFAALGAFAAAFDMVEDPLQLGAGEVRVGDQPGAVADVVLQAVALELLADIHAAPALPDDGVVDRLAGVFVPYHGGFALVGDADRRHLVEADAGLGQGFHQGSALGGPDFHGVVLDPAGLWVDLGEFALGHTGDIGVVVEDDGAGTGGALVEGDDVFLLVIGGHGRGLAVRINEGSNWAASCAVLA